jgi:hypothetical protein
LTPTDASYQQLAAATDPAAIWTTHSKLTMKRITAPSVASSLMFYLAVVSKLTVLLETVAAQG